MNVNCRPEMMGDHGRAFDMPARTPRPRAFPARQIVAGVSRHKVSGIALVGNFTRAPANMSARARRASDHILRRA